MVVGDFVTARGPEVVDDGAHAVDAVLWFSDATFHAPLQTLIGIDDICEILAPGFGQIILNL